MTRLLALLLLTSLPAAAQAQEVQIQTSLGEIDVQLDAAHAPKTVENFLRYAREGHFDGTVIYRVVPGFVLQMGSFEAGGTARPMHDPIPLETAAALPNLRGTLSMARSNLPNSATAEFFINLSDNAALDPKPGAPAGTTGYAVFGKVVEGMTIVDQIANVPLGGRGGPFPPNATPALPVTITKVSIVSAAAPATPAAQPAMPAPQAPAAPAAQPAPQDTPPTKPQP